MLPSGASKGRWRFFGWQCRSLRYDNFKVRCNTAPVAIEGQEQRRFCRLDGAVLLLGFLLENARCRQGVFDTLEGREDCLAISRHGRIIGGLRLLRERSAPTGVEHGLCQRRAEGPEGAWPGEQIR